MLHVDVLLVSLTMAVGHWVGWRDWTEFLTMPVFIEIVLSMGVLHAIVLSLGVFYSMFPSAVSTCLTWSFAVVLVISSTVASSASPIDLDGSKFTREHGKKFRLRDSTKLALAWR